MWGTAGTLIQELFTVSSIRRGSAAGARKALPQSAVRKCVARCITRLNNATELAAIAVTGPEPDRAARLLAAAVRAVRTDLRITVRARRAH